MSSGEIGTPEEAMLFIEYEQKKIFNYPLVKLQKAALFAFSKLAGKMILVINTTEHLYTHLIHPLMYVMRLSAAIIPVTPRYLLTVSMNLNAFGDRGALTVCLTRSLPARG
jgi:hypothetical protein